MNPENKTSGAGRVLAGYLLGIVLAVLAPAAMLTELLSLMVVIMVPAIGLIFLYRWAGKAPAILSAVLQLALNSMYLGSTFMWTSFFMAVLPLGVLVFSERQPFFTQMKRSIAAFGIGVVASVAVLYFSYGGNMIERVMLEFPKAVRALPAEAIQAVVESYASIAGEALTAEAFYKIFDDMIGALIPVYQKNLPGLIFSGALVSAVLCAGLSSWMLHRQGRSGEKCYLPLREWALPASTTGGLLLITLVSYFMSIGSMKSGDTVFYTVLNISMTAFCIQAFSSLARKMHISRLKQGTKFAITAALAVLSLLGANMYIALYGCGSAVLGSRGALRQRMMKNNSNDNNSSSDDE